MRMLFNSGPAVYRDDIATRDINELKKGFTKLRDLGLQIQTLF